MGLRSGSLGFGGATREGPGFEARELGALCAMRLGMTDTRAKVEADGGGSGGGGGGGRAAC